MTSTPAATRARDLARIAVFAALIAALTLLGSFQVGIVPITLQTLGVLLAGAILGPKNGPLAVLLYLAVGAIGIPVFAGGHAGIGTLIGPTGGFLLGFVLAAWVVGILTRRILPAYPFWPALGIMLLGSIAVYAVGAPWLAATVGPSALLGLGVFIPGDLIKVVLATLIAKSVHRSLPDQFSGARG